MLAGWLVANMGQLARRSTLLRNVQIEVPRDTQIREAAGIERDARFQGRPGSKILPGRPRALLHLPTPGFVRSTCLGNVARSAVQRAVAQVCRRGVAIYARIVDTAPRSLLANVHVKAQRAEELPQNAANGASMRL